MSPPLRTQKDVDAILAGLKDGTLSVLATDHAPHAPEKKERELDQAPNGILGLETFLPLCVTHLIEPGHLTWPQMLAKMTVNPAAVLGIDRGTLQPGSPADVTVIDPKAKWTIDKSAFQVQEPQHALPRHGGDRPRRGHHRRRRGEDEPAGVRRSRLGFDRRFRGSQCGLRSLGFGRRSPRSPGGVCVVLATLRKVGDLRQKLATFAHFLAAFAKSWRPCPLILAILITFFGDLRAHSGCLTREVAMLTACLQTLIFAACSYPVAFPRSNPANFFPSVASRVRSGAGVQAAPCCCSNWRTRSYTFFRPTVRRTTSGRRDAVGSRSRRCT